MQTNEKNNAEDPKEIMREVNQDLKNTRKSVAELMKYRASLMEHKDMTGLDADKIKEYRHKAIDAINHLFDEDLNPEH